MSLQEADRFIAAIRANPEQFADLEALAKAGDTAVVYEKVRALGYDATIEEIGDAFMEYISEEIGEEQLAEIAGGISDGEVIGAVVGGAAAVGVGAGVIVGTVVIATSSAAAAGAAI